MFSILSIKNWSKELFLMESKRIMSSQPSEKKVEVDSVVQAVLDRFVERSVMGKKKYGTDLDRTDLSVLEWIQHAQEEHMDAILYLEKLKREWKP